MNIGELLVELDSCDEGLEVMAVEQPSYPLIASIDRVEIRKKVVYIHLDPAYDYYGNEDEEEEE